MQRNQNRDSNPSTARADKDERHRKEQQILRFFNLLRDTNAVFYKLNYLDGRVGMGVSIRDVEGNTHRYAFTVTEWNEGEEQNDES